MCIKINKKTPACFHRDWLQMPEFSQWLHDVKDDNTGVNQTHKKIKRSNMGKLALSDYAKDSEHLIKLKKV